MKKGKITICGTGPTTKDLMTEQVYQFLKKVFLKNDSMERIYSLSHPIEIISKFQFYKKNKVRDLSSLYLVPKVLRIDVYKTVASMVTSRAADQGMHVIYLTAGSPYVLNDAVLHIRNESKRRNIEIEIMHGMSFIDLILEHTLWDGHGGLQFASAWNVVKHEIPISNQIPLIIYQIAEYTALGTAIDATRNNQGLISLQKVLISIYSPKHKVKILYSSGFPEYKNLVTEIEIQQLGADSVPVYSNLYVPPMNTDERNETTEYTKRGRVK